MLISADKHLRPELYEDTENKGQNIALGIKKLVRTGSGFGVSVNKDVMIANHLEEGEMFDVILTRLGFKKRKDNKPGSPLLIKNSKPKSEVKEEVSTNDQGPTTD